MADIDPERKIEVLRRAVLQLTKAKQDLEATNRSLEEKLVIVSTELARVNEHSTSLQERNRALEAEVDELRKRASQGIGSKLLGVASIVPRWGGGAAAPAASAAATPAPQRTPTPGPEGGGMPQLDAAQLFRDNEALHIQLFETRTALEEQLKDARRAQAEAEAKWTRSEVSLVAAERRVAELQREIESAAAAAQMTKATLPEADFVAQRALRPFGRAATARALRAPLLDDSTPVDLATHRALSLTLSDQAVSADAVAMVAARVEHWSASFAVVSQGISVLLGHLVSAARQGAADASARGAGDTRASIVVGRLGTARQALRNRSQAVAAAIAAVATMPTTAAVDLATALRGWCVDVQLATSDIVTGLGWHVDAQHNGVLAALEAASGRLIGGLVGELDSRLALLRPSELSPEATQLLLTGLHLAPALRSTLLDVAACIDDADPHLVRGATCAELRVALRQLSSELRRIATADRTDARGGDPQSNVSRAVRLHTIAAWARPSNAVFRDPTRAVVVAVESAAQKASQRLNDTVRRRKNNDSGVTASAVAVIDGNRNSDASSSNQRLQLASTPQARLDAMKLMLAAADAKAVEYHTTAMQLLAELEERTRRLDTFAREVEAQKKLVKEANEERAAIAEAYESQIRVLSERLAELS